MANSDHLLFIPIFRLEMDAAARSQNGVAKIDPTVNLGFIRHRRLDVVLR